MRGFLFSFGITCSRILVEFLVTRFLSQHDKIDASRTSSSKKMVANSTTSMLLIFFALVVCLSMQAASQSSDDCGTKYSCFLSPKGCKNDACSYIIKWVKSGNNSIHFILNTKTTYQNWLAIAFSYAQKMKNDSVALCKLDQSQPTVETYNNKGHSTPIILNSTYRSIGLSNISVSYKNSWLLCSFERQIFNATIGEKFFDLNHVYYLLVAKGPIEDEGEPGFHHSNYDISAMKIDFRNVSSHSGAGQKLLVRFHGAIMIFAWMVLSTIGIILARYFKNLYPEDKTCGVNLWFAYHRALMVSCPILSVIAFFLIFYEKKWTWIVPGFTVNFLHSVFGALALLLAVIQPVIASFRPDKNAVRRPLFNWSHRILGLSAFLFSHAAIFLGVYKDIHNDAGWGLLIFWFGWLVVLVVVLEININCCQNKKRVEYENLDDASKHIQQTNNTTKSSTNIPADLLVLIFHIVVGGVVTGVLIYFLFANF